jgi:hypothetical protein
MRKFAIALAALAAIGIAAPLTSSTRAEEAKVVIKTGDHDRDMQRHHKKKIVIIKHRRHRDHDHD